MGKRTRDERGTEIGNGVQHRGDEAPQARVLEAGGSEHGERADADERQLPDSIIRPTSRTKPVPPNAVKATKNI